MAGFGRALYYPHIDLRNDDWVKTAALYYDGIDRIVPTELKPRDGSAARFLIDRTEFVRNLDPLPDADATAAEFLEYALKYQQDASYRKRLENAMAEVSMESPTIRIHATKLSDHLKEELPRLGLAYHPEYQKSEHWDWYEFRAVTGAIYMACLANRIAMERGLPLVSDHPCYQWLVRGIQDGSSRNGPIEDKGYLLGSAVIEAAIPENLCAINIEDIVKFRLRHEAERRRFYDAVTSLAKDIPNIQHSDSLKDCIEHHSKTIEGAVKDLRLSLSGVGIACTTGFLGLSVPAWAPALKSLPQFGVQAAVGGVLTIACGILAREGLNYYRAKRNSPYSYVLSIKHQLRRRFVGQFNEGLHLL